MPQNDPHIFVRKSKRLLNSKNVAIASVSENNTLSMEVDESPIDIDESPMEVDDFLSKEKDFFGSPKKKKPRHEITKKRTPKESKCKACNVEWAHLIKHVKMKKSCKEIYGEEGLAELIKQNDFARKKYWQKYQRDNAKKVNQKNSRWKKKNSDIVKKGYKVYNSSNQQIIKQKMADNREKKRKATTEEDRFLNLVRFLSKNREFHTFSQF